jgi:TolA-binding protein
MKNIIRTAVCVIMLAGFSFTGCTGNKAKELFETAQLEELQNNPEHARQLYGEIITTYPETEYAKKARERMSALSE